MKAESLTEVVSRLGPSPDKHWIVPGVVAAGARIRFTGNAKTLLGIEAAVSAATCTPFMGTIPPWVCGHATVASSDLYGAADTAKKLLHGRNCSDESELHFVEFRPFTPDWDELAKTAVDLKTKLLVVDEGKPTTNAVFVTKALTQLRDRGVTVIAVPAVDDGTPWAVLPTSFDGLTLSLGNQQHCGVEFGRDSIELFRLPPGERGGLTKLEVKVWHAVLRWPGATGDELAAYLGYLPKDTTPVIRTLGALEARGAIKGCSPMLIDKRKQSWQPAPGEGRKVT